MLSLESMSIMVAADRCAESRINVKRKRKRSVRRNSQDNVNSRGPERGRNSTGYAYMPYAMATSTSARIGENIVVWGIMDVTTQRVQTTSQSKWTF